MVTTQFSDTQWNQIMEAWRIFDTDGDGLVTVEDLRTLMLSFGYDHSEKVMDSDSVLIPPIQLKFRLKEYRMSRRSISQAAINFPQLSVRYHANRLSTSSTQELAAYLDDLPICVEGDRYNAHPIG
jgi:hypothetical protein